MSSLDRLLKARPQGLVEGVQILVDRTEDVVKVMTRYGYTDPETIGGYLDRDLPDPPDVIAEDSAAGPPQGDGHTPLRLDSEARRGESTSPKRKRGAFS